MKTKLPATVKEQMKYAPDLPIPTNSWGKSWEAHSKRSTLKDDIGFEEHSRFAPDKVENATEEPELAHADDYGTETAFHASALETVATNPRSNEDVQDRFCANYSTPKVNANYDETFNTESAKRGFNHKKLDSLAPEYTAQHATIFYDEVTRTGQDGETVTGFLERGNFLDRI